MGMVGAEKEKPGRSTGCRVWALGEGARLGRGARPGPAGYSPAGREDRRAQRARARQAATGRLETGSRGPRGSAGNPGAPAAPPRPAPAAPPLPSRGPPLGVSAGAAAALPRDRIRLGARGSGRKATGSTARGTERRVPANAGGTNQPGAWCPGAVPARRLL